MEVENSRKAWKAFGWGLLGWLACWGFETALGLVGLGVFAMLGDSADPFVGWWSQAGWRERLVFSMAATLPAVGVGVAIRKRRKAFVVGWFLPLILRLPQWAYYWILSWSNQPN